MAHNDEYQVQPLQYPMAPQPLQQIIQSFDNAAQAMRHAAGAAETLSGVLKRHPHIFANDPALMQLANEMSMYMPHMQPHHPFQPPPLQQIQQMQQPQAVQGKGRKRKANDDEPEPEDAKKKPAKKIKDPNAPKRPASSYIMFQNEVRGQLRAENPKMGNSELLGKISQLWAEMPADEKTKYESERAKQKEVYEGAKQAYDARTPEEKAATVAALEAAEAAAPAKRTRKKAVAKTTSPEAGDEEHDTDSTTKAAAAAVVPPKMKKSKTPAVATEAPAVTKKTSSKPAAATTAKSNPATAAASSEEDETDEDEEEDVVPPKKSLPPKKSATTAKPVVLSAPPIATNGTTSDSDEDEDEDEEDEEEEDHLAQTPTIKPALKKSKLTHPAPVTNGRAKK